MTRSTSLRWADSAGVFGAVIAALCCMGASVIVGVLGAIGLSWLRQDAILWPMMFGSLAIAYWGFWSDRHRHRTFGPLALAIAGGASLVAGVVFVHGYPAREMIYGGSAALIIATVWNIALRRRTTAMV
jgi:mercuric ion transport protein